MRNKKPKWNREDWISVVITLVFILGFLVLANSEAIITGLTTVEQPTTIDFEVNSVIPSTATLEISSGTQVQQMNLSEFTVKLNELKNIRPILKNGSLVAYNITNITIDLEKYNIEPSESISIRFLEIYKEITIEPVTKRITKEEVVIEEIVTVTENITKEPEFAIQPTEEIPKELQFGIVATDKKYYLQRVGDSYFFDESESSGTMKTETCNVAGGGGDCSYNFTISPTYSTDTIITTDPFGARIYWYGSGDTDCYLTQVDLLDCGPTSTCTTVDATICSDATDYTNCYNDDSNCYTDVSCTPTQITLDAGDYLGIRITMHSKRCDSNLKYNSTNTPTYLNVTEDIPNVAPVVGIYWPENNTQSPSHSVNFTYNVTDSDGIPINCSLLLEHGGNWVVNASNATAIVEGSNETINITLSHENINWTIQCEDAGGEKANATRGWFNYTVYDTTPSPSLVSPANNTYNISHSANFTYQVTSLDNVINCTLLLEKAGQWETNKSNQSAITQGIDQSINITLSHEIVNWTIQCENIYSEKANATNGYFNYSVYDATPTVTLVWPGNNTYQTSSKNVNLTYNVTSLDSSLTCDLYINDAWNSTDTGIERSVNQTFNLTFDSYQNFNWSVGCNNTFDEYVNSTMYNYSLMEQLNQAPTIPTGNISSYSPTTPSIILDSYRSVSLTFAVCDPDSVDVSGLTPYANVTGANDTNNYYERNITCVPTGWSNTSCKQINCSFNLWYWYKQGSWNISMNVTDGTYWAHNNAPSFNLGSTTGIVISPSALEWATTLYAGQWNKTSSNDPILINNTGNDNISLSKVNVTAYNLRGETAGYESNEIPAANFTIGLDTDANNIECIGTAMSNATSTNIPSSMLPRGNHSINNNETGQENLFFCLVNIPYGLSEQSYSTQNSQQWKIGVS